MGEVVNIEAKLPHAVIDMTCEKCEKNWIAVAALKCTQLECPDCGHMTLISQGDD